MLVRVSEDEEPQGSLAQIRYEPEREEVGDREMLPVPLSYRP